MLNDYFANGLGSVYICLAAILSTLIYKIVEHCLFIRHMKKIGFPSSSGLGLLTPIRFLSKQLEYRKIGYSWFISHFNAGLLVFSATALLLGLYRSYLILKPTEFQRLGAIVVAVGLLSIINGMREERMLKDRWEDIEENSDRPSFKPLANVIDKPIEHASRKATIFSVALSLVGTIVWAYGDQFLGCAVFPAFELAAGAVCDLQD